MNTIFQELIYSKIERFLFEYKNLSRSIFLNEDGSLAHPGEFGMYRERIVSDLLQPFLPNRLAVGTGFIITHQNGKSTQCDLIIYDRQNTPIIENGEQRFFPVECVVGVVEVKSKLTKSTLKEALQKLSTIKQLRKDIDHRNPYIFKDGVYHGFDATTNPLDQIATFLICESLDFDISECYAEYFDSVYDGIDKSLYHNMVLSLGDCLCLYHDGNNRPIFHSYFEYSEPHFDHALIKPISNGYAYEHILIFVNYFYMLISSISVMYIEFTNYISQGRYYKFIRPPEKSKSVDCEVE